MKGIQIFYYLVEKNIACYKKTPLFYHLEDTFCLKQILAKEQTLLVKYTVANRMLYFIKCTQYLNIILLYFTNAWLYTNVNNKAFSITHL